LSALATLAILFCALGSVPALAQQRDLTVFAAASLKNALDDIGRQYQSETGHHINVSLAASSALAKQIENGAPGDLFLSADLDWMDYLAARHLIKPESRKNLLGNKLVLIAPADAPPQNVKIVTGFPLAALLHGGRLAMGDTAAVPAGKYGKAALEKLGVWTSVQTQIAQAENVRAALALVARGEAPFGIVYASDAVAEPHVRVVGVFPEDTHPPIVYPVAILTSSTNPEAAAFAAYLQSPRVKPIFEKHGFIVLK
jgi:molybdate transport system substrate-binding protein